MRFLDIFSTANLALLADWLEATGELYVNWYVPNVGATTYFIRTLQDLKQLILHEGWQPIDIMIFRRLQFPLRGVADEQLLQQVFQLIPDDAPYDIIYFRYYPEQAAPVATGTGHADLRRELTDVFGEQVAVGQEPDVYSAERAANLGDVLEIDVWYRDRQYHIRKNQDFYQPYAKEPHRYAWIEKLWQS